MGQAPAPVAAPRTLLQVTPSPQRGTQTQESPPPPALHCIFLTPGHDARRAPVNNSCLAGASSASPRGPYSPGAGYFPPLRPGSAACKHSTRGDLPRRSQGPRAPGTPVRTTKSCLAAGKSLVNPQGSWESPDFTVVLILAVAKHTALTLNSMPPPCRGDPADPAATQVWPEGQRRPPDCERPGSTRCFGTGHRGGDSAQAGRGCHGAPSPCLGDPGAPRCPLHTGHPSPHLTAVGDAAPPYGQLLVCAPSRRGPWAHLPPPRAPLPLP